MTEGSFPEFITARRRELELTLGDVASSLGVSPITVSNWSSGDSKPKPDNLAALAKLLEVPADELADMAGVTLKSATEGVNLMPTDVVEADTEGAEDAENAVIEDIGEAVELPPSERVEQEDLSEPVSTDAPEVEIPEAEPVSTDAPEVEIPEAEPVSTDAPEVEIAEAEPADSEPTDEKADPTGEDEPAPDSVPAFVAAEAPASEKTAAEKRRPALRRPAAATAAAGERQVTTLPLTYIEDPKQLMRYRIRWALTVVILLIMFIVLLWASRELLSALSEIKQAVTPGGVGGG